MEQVFLFLWQLPQNLIGVIVCIITNPKIITCNIGGKEYYYFLAQRLRGGWGVSLGNFMIFGYKPMTDSIKHENGHQKQSLYLGWLYLIIIGIPSFFGSVLNILFHRNWTMRDIYDWYYGLLWERWADMLGGVKR